MMFDFDGGDCACGADVPKWRYIFDAQPEWWCLDLTMDMER